MQFHLQTWCRRAAGSDEPWRRHLVRPGLYAVWCRLLMDPAKSTLIVSARIPDLKARAGVRSRMPRATFASKYELANGYEDEHHVRQVEYRRDSDWSRPEVEWECGAVA